MLEGSTIALRIKVRTKNLVSTSTQDTIETRISGMSIRQVFIPSTRHAHHLNEESTNDPVRELQDEGFDLEMEGDFAECLGIGTEHRDDAEPSA